MDGDIDANAPLDYAEFQLFPSQDRYEACVCSGNKVERIASGLLGQLVLHLPVLKDLFLRGSNAKFKLRPSKNLESCQWFTKATLTRFLHIVGSPNILNPFNAIEDEISQLEEARKFHLSLYTKDRHDHSGDGKAVSCNLNGMGQKLEDEVKIVSSDESKNELLRAMNLRLATLRGELVAAFNRAAGATCSSNNIFDMEKLCQHFEAIDLRNTLRKFVVLGQVGQTADLPGVEKSPSTVDSRNNRANEPEGNAQKPSHSDTPVKYGVSPAKAAQVERQSSTESEESCHSSGDDQPSVERSRTLIRSASPRRSASPMRRVQIGRSGSRRATALTIKSLTYFPARDRTLSCREATEDSNEDEGTEQPPQRSDGNIRRMSVQDAISLFEGKRRDQTSDIQQGKSTLDAFAGTNKSVLRRWSSGMGDSSTQRLPEIVSESSDPMTSDYLEGVEIPRSSFEAKPEPEFISGDNSPVETVEENANLDTVEERMSNPVSSQADTLGTQREENTERLTASVEWNRQKEEELNQMLMKMMESNPVKYRNIAPDNNRSQDVPHEERGGFYDHYKGKRDEKLRGETAGKRAEKAAQFRAMQQVLDERKSEMASANLKGRKTSLAKPQKSLKSSTQSTIPKKEPSKPVVTKKALSKSSSSPATRKSWPSTPSPRATTRISPAKTLHGTSSSATTPTCQKTQLAPSGSRSSPKLERSVQKPKNVKPSQNDTRKSMKDVTPKPQHPLTKNGKTGKTKVQTTPVKDRPVAEAKPSFYNKVTKKSSVVPLESKPFLRKGSGIGPGVGPVVKTKASSQPEETLKSSDLIQAQENELVIDTSDPVSQQQEGDFEAPETHAGLESETQLTTQQKYDGTLSSEQVIANCNDSFVMATESELKTEVEEESVISPTAWIEIEEHQNLSIPSDYSTCEIASAANVASIPTSSPHVRHSLSQMLLEESAERDIIEWGNAENPPVMVYQKDAPKGLKRLLKFARKSRADPNLAGWSSPSVFSEGEDDAEESKAASKKNADNLRRKAALHAKNYGQQKASLGEGYEENSAFPEILSAHSNTSKFSAQSSSHKLQDHISVAATTTKATRSFFSLSAFRGSKPNEMKLR
ncbi:Neurofilament medium polypeptide like [Actinidia chinensis var. chinensis]|uniref:Neurofilament medium polypeptide like n=1 Tax=Actinidia chinensis var. chinensis TaxID=1590841 RepID=A0A2R6RT70_ACTCC|nr:Neurofilament medium polypeptide like [Actinidia chinensis var. chinensis]